MHKTQEAFFLDEPSFKVLGRQPSSSALVRQVVTGTVESAVCNTPPTHSLKVTKTWIISYDIPLFGMELRKTEGMGSKEKKGILPLH